MAGVAQQEASIAGQVADDPAVHLNRSCPAHVENLKTRADAPLEVLRHSRDRVVVREQVDFALLEIAHEGDPALVG